MSKKPGTPQDTQNRNKKIKVAIMCIAAIVIFYVGANFLKGVNVFHKTIYYYCVMDNAMGVQQSTPVMLNGYKVGFVQETKLLGTNPVKICAKILFNENIDIPDDTELVIMSKDLLGGQMLSMVMGTSKTYFHDGDTIKCSMQPGMLDGIDEMKGQIASVLASVDTIGLTLKDVLHKDGGGESLKATLENIESSTEHLNNILAQNETKVGRVVTELDKFTHTLNEVSPQLTTILDNFDQVSDSLAKADIASTINNANQAIEEVKVLIEKVNNGEGSVGALMNDEGVAKKLEASINSLDDLLKDLKAHPKRYVHFSLFGKKDK